MLLKAFQELKLNKTDLSHISCDVHPKLSPISQEPAHGHALSSTLQQVGSI